MKEVVADPFKKHGYPPVVIDVTVEALKRGPRGARHDVPVADEDSGLVLTPNDCQTIAYLVDTAVGVNSGSSVGYGVLAVLASKA